MIKRLLYMYMVVVVSRVYPFQASFRDTEPSCLRKISVLLWLCRTLELAFGCTWRRYVSNYRYSLLRVKTCSQHTNWTELNCRACTAACSQSTSRRWRAWPITRRVTGSTRRRAVQFSSVQFACCEHGFTTRPSTCWREVCTDLMKLRGYCVTNFTLYTDHVRCGARDQTDF